MIRKHVGEKPHSCKQYNYTSTTFSDALQIHMMKQNGEKPYKFNQCDCTYAQAHKLQKHKMTHTGEKAHIPSLPYTRSKIWYTNEDAHRVEVLQIQPVRLHLHSSR